MNKIIILDEATINKIAAGECVERPASVVKELVENSIDAGATQIKIVTQKAGKAYISVSDNGSGMTEQDALLAFERHSTSKIRDADDLTFITSMGFRGEALASISAISRVNLTTRTEATPTGVQVLMEGGNLQEVKQTACPVGTNIEVRDIFFNTPARYKFLKNDSIERGYINDVVMKQALAQPKVRIRLIHDGKEAFLSPGTSLLDTIISVYGREIAKAMIPINGSKGALKITGYISGPSITRANRRHELTFVNSRPIESKLLKNAIEDAYGTLLFRKRFPITIIFYEIDPSEIDPNVHPQKREIRIAEEELFYSATIETIKRVLEKKVHIPETAPVQDLSSTLQPSISSAKGKMDPSYKTSGSEDFSPISSKLNDSKVYNTRTATERIQRPLFEPQASLIKESKIEPPPKYLKFPKESRLPSMLFIGTVHKTYLICQDQEGLLLIDQHAAAERVTYERIKKDVSSINPPTQQLLAPLTLEVTPGEYEILKNRMDILKTLGFMVEEFGTNTFAIRSLPRIFEETFNPETIYELMDQIIGIKTVSLAEIKDEIIILMACHGSIRAGDQLNRANVEKLLFDLSQTENPFTCPHGRPVIIKMTWNELESKFKRNT
ncbi:MAG: DNA mismatch repair endonuclease MutL [Candidatus Hermodarchaeota archaeon]